MNKIVTALAVLVIVGIGAYYLVFRNNGQNSQTSTVPSVSSTETGSNSGTAPFPSAPTSQTVSVDISNFAFNPPTLTVKVGTTVTWTNKDSVTHTVTSDSGTLLDSPSIPPGQSFSFTFTSSGTESYHCTIHPMMKGKIVIQN